MTKEQKRLKEQLRLLEMTMSGIDDQIKELKIQQQHFNVIYSKMANRCPHLYHHTGTVSFSMPNYKCRICGARFTGYINTVTSGSSFIMANYTTASTTFNQVTIHGGSSTP